mmetsp:Transcript_16056/g.43313  ORF Transcript_16056/g.43313 Transcript_16056/m.43313 type:complete len:425 (+) Transcript_16056:367-1641(+)
MSHFGTCVLLPIEIPRELEDDLLDLDWAHLSLLASRQHPFTSTARAQGVREDLAQLLAMVRSIPELEQGDGLGAPIRRAPHTCGWVVAGHAHAHRHHHVFHVLHKVHACTNGIIQVLRVAMASQVRQLGLNLAAESGMVDGAFADKAPLARSGIQPTACTSPRCHKVNGLRDHLVGHQVRIQPEGRENDALANQLGRDGDLDLERARVFTSMVPVDLDADIVCASNRHRLLPSCRREAAILSNKLGSQGEVVLRSFHSAMCCPREAVLLALLEILGLVREYPESAHTRGHNVYLHLACTHHLAVLVHWNHCWDGSHGRLQAARHDIEILIDSGLVPLHGRHHPAGNYFVVEDELQDCRGRVAPNGALAVVGERLVGRLGLPRVQEARPQLDDDPALQERLGMHLGGQRHTERPAIPCQAQQRIG